MKHTFFNATGSWFCNPVTALITQCPVKDGWCLKSCGLWPRTGFSGGSVVKNPPDNAGDARDVGLISGSGSSHGVRNGNPLWYSCLENSVDRGAWWAAVHGVTKDQTWLSTHTHTHTHTILITTLWVKWDWYSWIYRWGNQSRGNEGICSRSYWYYRMSNNLENNCTSSIFIPFPNQTCSEIIHI